MNEFLIVFSCFQSLTIIISEYNLRTQSDELSLIYGLENLQGLGYLWKDNKISYAIGLKVGKIKDFNLSIELPDENWTEVHGKTTNLKEIYDEIYKSGSLKYEIETFTEDGKCLIKYYR